jgi:hypothetical protein
LMLGAAGGAGTAGWVFGKDLDADPDTLGDQTGLSYAGGVNYARQCVACAWNATGFDRGFQTFVQAGAVPEPATWAMLILGFGALGATMRRGRAGRPSARRPLLHV